MVHLTIFSIFFVELAVSSPRKAYNAEHNVGEENNDDSYVGAT